jgi:hypothetical protein
LYAPQLSAQVRAAVVKNVDEPGRSPYQAVQTSFNNCGVYGWAYFPAVPAGKRLVVTHASGQFQLTTSSIVRARLLSVPSTATSSCAVISGVPFALLPPIDFSSLIASFAGPTQFYVEEGAIPAIFVQSPFDLSAGKVADFSIQGYLIDKSL